MNLTNAEVSVVLAVGRYCGDKPIKDILEDLGIEDTDTLTRLTDLGLIELDDDVAYPTDSGFNATEKFIEPPRKRRKKSVWIVEDLNSQTVKVEYEPIIDKKYELWTAYESIIIPKPYLWTDSLTDIRTRPVKHTAETKTKYTRIFLESGHLRAYFLRRIVGLIEPEEFEDEDASYTYLSQKYLQLLRQSVPTCFGGSCGGIDRLESNKR